jgi:hypothetical protein
MAVIMRLVIRPIEAGHSQAVVSLYRWLSCDAGLARYGQVTVDAADQEQGRMGGVLDVINAVFADAGAAAGVGSLLVAYWAWRDTRTQAPAFRIEKDGVTVVVDRGSEDELSRVLSVLVPDADATDCAGGSEEDAERR